MTPVVVVHGYEPGSTCPSTNPQTSMFGPIAYMRYYGGEFPRAYDPVAFYACDLNGSNMGVKADDNTPIETIAFNFAWYIYNTYTSKNVVVSVVGYSMGGLIVREALRRFAAHDPSYPGTLLVQDVVTVATPHAGISLSCATYQCQEMSPNSNFLKSLATNQNPQATGGTDWTVMGGSTCDVVSETSAMAMTGAHRWSYALATSSAQCYTHATYMWDASTATDMPVRYETPGSSTWVNITSVHSLAAIEMALDSPSW